MRVLSQSLYQLQEGGAGVSCFLQLSSQIPMGPAGVFSQRTVLEHFSLLPSLLLGGTREWDFYETNFNVGRDVCVELGGFGGHTKQFS